MSLAAPAAWALPPGFLEEEVSGGWNEVDLVVFSPDGSHMYVVERKGRIWVVENGVPLPTPLIDISDEVGGWRDYGLLGVAFHPNFANNGYLYLLYVVDHHHLIHAGTPSYNPNTDEYFMATIGRVTRYTARAADDFHTVDYASRRVLIGETIDTGLPILHQSHGTGSILFSPDGTLILSTGDGASYSATDTGGSVGGSYAAQALTEGIISPKEDIGALRSQLLDSHAGKLLRFDPETGDGVPSNPFYDPLAPRAPRSRVWALGLRNPYRTLLRPGTGSHIRADADPGSVYIGDVGWGTWEDLHVANAPGLNFGWPLFEGLTVHSGYWASNVYNLDAPNPLFGQGGCTQEYFYFGDLTQQDTLDPTPFFPNPCDAGQSIPGSIPTFLHARPKIDWRHGAAGPSRTGIFSGQSAGVINLDDPSSPVPGPNFGGNASTGGVWYPPSGPFPPEYRDTYFHADYGAGWIKSFGFDAGDQPLDAVDFLPDGGGVVSLAVHPTDGDLYYVRWSSSIRRIRYVGSGNFPPSAVATADLQYGTTPLTVQLDGSGSSDPEGNPLSYAWDFGDGSPISTQVSPGHTFTAPPGVPTAYTVRLTVTDDGAAVDDAELVISVNNTPPQVTITSPIHGSTYAVGGPDLLYDLTADIADAEHGAGELSCEWLVALYHNEHHHPEPVVTDCASQAVLSPIGCDGNLYWWRATLTVTDAAGLSTSELAEVYPDCPNVPPDAGDDAASVAQGYAVDIEVLANDLDSDGSIDPATVVVTALPAHGAAVPDPVTGVVTYTHGGDPGALQDSFQYTVSDDDGAPSNFALVTVDAFNSPPTVAITQPPDGSGFDLGQAVPLAAAASDPEDGPALAYLWDVDLLHNDHRHDDVYVSSDPAPADFQADGWGDVVGGDRLSYLVNVTVADVIGTTASDRVHILPNAPAPNGAPVASFSADPVAGTAPVQVDLDASASSDPEGDYLLHDWDFGDGAEGGGAIVSHLYTQPGSYNVTLTVTDAGGATDQAVQQIDALGSGLEGTYYDNIDFTAPVLTRIDPSVDFNWGTGSPDPAVGANTFSVQWRGQLVPLYDELYTMYTVSDDGIRLWIDGQLVIDHWSDHAPTERSGSIALQAGVAVPIQVDFYENGGGAVAELRWESASTPKEVVPSSRLLAPSPPFADAGPDQVVTDSDGDGAEDVALDGTGSLDLDGAITAYAWREGASQVATGPSPIVTLAVGVHVLELEVTDADSNTDTDTVLVSVEPPVAVCGDGVVDPLEQCDDGNTAPGDCCSATCSYEPVDSPCADDANACTLDVCDAAGTCLHDGAALDGAACDDGDLCTQTDTCQLGVCAGAAPVVCVASDQCHEAGICNPATGACSDPPKPDGSPCDDAGLCTASDQCTGGACAGAPLPDGDSDTVCDDQDNCPYTANTDQSDAGGWGALSPPDGVGDVCQCGDVDADGFVTDSDLQLVRQQLVGLVALPAPDLCNVHGAPGNGPGTCEVDDATVMARGVSGLGPGPAVACSPAMP